LLASKSSSSLPQEAREKAASIAKVILQIFLVLISVVLYSIFNVSTIINAVKREILHRWALNVLNRNYFV
jgi:hypothetical protein